MGPSLAGTWHEGVVSADNAALRDIDTSVAHSARVYDYWLGGKDNFAVDREAAEEVLRARPAIRLNVRSNRAFLARSVRYLADEKGLRQFLDIGTGIPSASSWNRWGSRPRWWRRVPAVHRRPARLAAATRGRPIPRAVRCLATRHGRVITSGSDEVTRPR